MHGLYCSVFGCVLLLVITISLGDARNVAKHGNLNIFHTQEGVRWSILGKNANVRASGQLSVGNAIPTEKCDSGVFCQQNGNKKIEIQADTNCIRITSMSSDPSTPVEDCIDLGDANWYGGAEQWNQLWPLEKYTYDEYSYITKENSNMAVVERYWLNSNGIYFYVDSDVPLFIDQNNHRNQSLCFMAKNEAPYTPREALSLTYTICGANSGNAKEAHYDAITRFLGKPTGIPDERMIRHPVWSTWARYKSAISQDLVLEFAQEIRSNGFKDSQLEIDDLWETCYGSFTFDTKPSKFPDMKELSLTLKSLDFRVTLWIHPFINFDCEPYHSFALENNYLVKNVEGSVETKWWNGNGSVIDVTNPEAADWWSANLQKLLDNELIDSFKFDAGETSWLPQVPVLNAPIEQQPGIYTKKYSEVCSKFGEVIEVRVGHYTQQLPVFVRMIDKDSRWGYNNGLKSLVTTLLQMNMVGYPFVLPDMIGGNGYNKKPTKELFIRWLQANTFMPTLQFSYAPWDYDQETVEIAKTFTKLHYDYAILIADLARKAVEDGSPINPPIWWADPEDYVALGIDDEFLLGEDLLVAPVLEEGATSRDVYLPQGTWHDQLADEHFVGPTWLRNYSAPLDTLPYFTRLTSSKSCPTVDDYCVVNQ